jgi:hypothetical protein
VKEETQFWIVMFVMIVVAVIFVELNFPTTPEPGSDITIWGLMAMITMIGIIMIYWTWRDEVND